MKKKKVKSERKLKNIEKELWKLCRQICFITLANKSGGVDCYTCPAKNLVGQNCQLGHGHPKGALGASMTHDLRILRWQCYNCNINYGGMGGIFRGNLNKEYGKEATDKLYQECQASKGKPVKAREYYLKLIEEYKQKLKEL